MNVNFFLLSFHHTLKKKILGHLKPLLILLTQTDAVSLLAIHLHHTDVNNCTVQMITKAELTLKFYNSNYLDCNMKVVFFRYLHFWHAFGFQVDAHHNIWKTQSMKLIT